MEGNNKKRDERGYSIINREILFKGFYPTKNGFEKVFVNGEWIKGIWIEGAYMPHYYSSRYGKIPAIFVNDDVLGKTHRYPVIPETVGQYTDLTDKNGKKIFEGDIVKFTTWDHNGSDTQHIGVVKFACGMWGIWKTPKNEYWGDDGAFELYMVHSNDDEIEVIGNIHSNPELLEVSE